jgi:hypothetical protein
LTDFSESRLKIFVVAGHFSAHFWVLGFDQSPDIFDQSLKIGVDLGKITNFGQISGHLPGFAHF